MRLFFVGAVAVACVALAGCTNSPEDAPSSDSAASVEVPAPEPVEEETFTLPDGYPQIVEISTIPEHIRWAFEEDGTDQAVAVAEGVWAHLTPGATMEDAVNSLVYEGYCSSKEALEREYLNGETTPGMCW